MEAQHKFQSVHKAKNIGENSAAWSVEKLTVGLLRHTATVTRMQCPLALQGFFKFVLVDVPKPPSWTSQLSTPVSTHRIAEKNPPLSNEHHGKHPVHVPLVDDNENPVKVEDSCCLTCQEQTAA